MGVNLSAVLIRGEDILGDRVNIAAAARRRSRRHRSHWYHADPRLGPRPGEEENAARSAAKNKKRVSALADCVILPLRVLGQPMKRLMLGSFGLVDDSARDVIV